MPDEPHDPVLEALWARVLGAWDDPRVHTAALDHAVRSESLPELAGRYRALADDAERGDLAKMRLEAIVASAVAMLDATKAPPPTRVPLGITLTVFALCAIVLVWLAWVMFGHGT
jgi:hypothetical protein